MADSFNFASVTERIAHLRQIIPTQTRIVAVTKTVPAELMREAYATGIRDFGENRIQEAVSKQESLADLTDITWHFIGHLQSNKAKLAISRFQWIQSVDTLSLAQRLDRLAADQSLTPQICLQVKLRDDPSKFGWIPEDLLSQLKALQDCHHLDIRGLMTILPAHLSESEQLAAFKAAQSLAHQIQQHSTHSLPISELSMGMSSDYHLAIQAGATMIRPGRILFGSRNPSK